MTLRTQGYALAALVFVLDQLLKWVMLGPLALREVGQIVLLPIFRLYYVENRGVSLGMLTADSEIERWLLVALTGAIAVGVSVWIARERNRWDVAALALVLGGALGNILDRARLGYVVDFLDLHFGAIHPFYVFNLADSAISIGVVLLLARSLLLRDKPAQTPANPAVSETLH